MFKMRKKGREFGLLEAYNHKRETKNVLGMDTYNVDFLHLRHSDHVRFSGDTELKHILFPIHKALPSCRVTILLFDLQN